MAIKDYNVSDDIRTMVLAPIVKDADTNCSSADGRGFKEVVHDVFVGASGDTLSGSVKIELELEESDDDSTFTDCADASITNSVTGTNTGCFGVIDGAADDDTAYYTEYRGKKRYTRVVLNFTGTHTNGTPISVIALRRGPKQLPAVSGAY